MQLIITDGIASQKQNHTTYTSNTMFIDFVGATYSRHGGGVLVPLGVFERRTRRLASCGGAAATGRQVRIPVNVTASPAKVTERIPATRPLSVWTFRLTRGLLLLLQRVAL